jgi:signal transduction histidine kinase/ligand-binding sensor domain-containing protein
MLKIGWACAVTWLILGGFALAAPGASNTALTAHSPFIIDVWESGPGEQKLPQSSVFSIIQGREGYLWFGTLNGLVRFDGVRFTVFDVANTPALECNQVIHLFEDSQTNLWVGTETAGIVLIQAGGRMRNLGIGRGRLEQRLVSACEDSTGAVWLYTADGQLSRCRNGKPETWPLGGDQFGYSKTVISVSDGMLWVSAAWGQVAINPSASFAAPVLPLQEMIRANTRLDFLLAARNGGYWRLADGRVRWLQAALERDLGPYAWDLTRTPVTSACEDEQGNLIVGTLGEGVFFYTPDGQVTQISTAQGLSNNFILSLCLDHEGDLWVGTDGGGLNRVKRRVFNVIEESRPWTMQSICEDERSGLWLGTFGSGLKYLANGVVQSWSSEQGSFTNLYIRSVFVDRDSRVLVGAAGYGLLQVTNRFVPVSEVTNPFVSAIYQDRRGRIWVGTQGGLVCQDGSTWKTYTRHDGLSSDFVRAIADDAEGNIWIGTEGGGLNRLRDGRFTLIPSSNRATNETISALLVDGDGVLWIGTDGVGLARLQHGQWTSYTRRNGLASDSIGYLAEDALGYLWMGSYAGLMRAPKKALNDFASGLIDFIPCRAFGRSDGLPGSECTQGSQPAACLARDGQLWFPTTKGLVSLDPSRLKINTNQAPVIIESVLVDGQEQNTNSFGSRPHAITIPPGKERLEIYYTSLNFSAPGNVRFKYQLAGHESAWTDADGARVARFPKLPPGRYRFRVTACNEDGVWNETGAGLAVSVLPPFWRTWWFMGINAALLAGTFVLIVRYFSTQKLQRQLAALRQQEALEKERARIARDLHDQLGANLTQVTLLGEMAETDKEQPAEVESHARQIAQTARETTRALDEIVWAVNPSNDSLEGLITYACKYAQEFFATAGLRYRLEVPTRLPDLGIPPEVRHNVFLAFKEAVNNVVKHAEATEAWIRLQLEDDRFVIEIQDNGRGLAGQEERAGRNGLRNMRRRLEDVGGTFAISPAPTRGTLVRLMAPVGNR